jgi:RimJ/RimL family protein N-acetyltransferase
MEGRKTGDEPGKAMGERIDLDIIRTSRLRLRKLQPADASLIQQLNSDPEVMRFIGPVETGLEKAQAYTDLRVAQYRDRPGLGIFVAELAGTASETSEYKKENIGWFCLKSLEETEEVEVGYRLLPKYWNQGYATEGAKAMLNQGFRALGLDKIVGVTLPTNLASQAILKKVGMVYVGIKTYYGHELCYFRRGPQPEWL